MRLRFVSIVGKLYNVHFPGTTLWKRNKESVREGRERDIYMERDEWERKSNISDHLVNVNVY